MTSIPATRRFPPQCSVEAGKRRTALSPVGGPPRAVLMPAGSCVAGREFKPSSDVPRPVDTALMMRKTG